MNARRIAYAVLLLIVVAGAIAQPTNPNLVQGSCLDYFKKIMGYGVSTPDGKGWLNHPGLQAVTHATWAQGTPEIKEWDTSPGRHCIDARLRDLSIPFTQKVHYLEWDDPKVKGNLLTACGRSYKEMKRLLVAHEQMHVQDNLAVDAWVRFEITKLDDWGPRTFCQPTSAPNWQQIRAGKATWGETEINRIRADAAQRSQTMSDQVHATNGAGVPRIRCTLCGDPGDP
jgi:hypothetical protein